MLAAEGQAELHTFSLIKNLHRLVRCGCDSHFKRWNALVLLVARFYGGDGLVDGFGNVVI